MRLAVSSSPHKVAPLFHQCLLSFPSCPAAVRECLGKASFGDMGQIKFEIQNVPSGHQFIRDAGAEC